jgi:4-diphosphocytidyl-2C-methyl-D-erythritol kinase
LGHNDLLGPALELAPELAGAQALLARACPAPLASGLSGSGPTFWLVYGSGEEAARAASHLRAMAVAERPGERWLVVSTSIA